MKSISEDLANKGQEVVKQLGALEAITEEVESPCFGEHEIDSEEVGSFFTLIGKAILAIFK